MRSLGLFICSFDPVLDGHMVTARSALRELKLDRILFIPFADKTESPASSDGDGRLEMCRRAVADEDRMEAGLFIRSVSDLSRLYARCCEEYKGGTLLCLTEDRVYQKLFGKKQRPQPLKNAPFLLIGNPASKKGSREVQIGGGETPFFSDISFGRAEKQAKRQIRNLTCPEDMADRVLALIAERGMYQPDRGQEIRSMISEHRWIHTLGVRSTAVRLACRFGANPLKAAAAALYHDCAKDMGIREMRRIMTQEYRCDDEEILRSTALMHGPAGAVVARDRFGITDPEVLDAIRYHTTGRPGMTPLDLVVFVADAIEPNREDYPGLSEIRRLSEQSLALAALESLRRTVEFVTAQGRVFNRQGEATMRALEIQTGTDARSRTPEKSAAARPDADGI